MPELPEVETLKRELARVLIGREIKEVKIFWPKGVAPLSPALFARKIKGAKIITVDRRAKILLLTLDNNYTLAIHLKMTGQLIYDPQSSTLMTHEVEPLIIGGHPEPQPQGLSLDKSKDSPFNYTRVILTFTDGSKLYFNDLRKFGWLRLMKSNEVKSWLAHLGWEPLTPSFTFKKFETIINRYPNRRIKHTLLDQTLVAGLGNIYVDESCFASRIKPDRLVKTLKPLEIKKLYREIKRILNLAIKKGGTSARNYVRSNGARGGFVPYLKVYGRSGAPCRRCQTPISKIKVAGRGTHFCAQCQN